MAAWKITCVALLCGVSTAALGQDFPVMDWGGIIQSEAMASAVEETARSNSAGRQTTPGSAVPAGTIPARLSEHLAGQLSGAAPGMPGAALDYDPRPEVRERLARIMGEAAGRTDPAKGTEMRELVLSGKAVAEYARIAPTRGFRANHAADAFAFYLMTQWGVANDHRAAITPAQAAAVRQQAANALASVSDHLATDALRQEFAEMLIVQGIIMAGVHEDAVRKGDDVAARRYAAIARRGGQLIFSIDPTDVALTDAGFRKR